MSAFTLAIRVQYPRQLAADPKSSINFTFWDWIIAMLTDPLCSLALPSTGCVAARPFAM